MLEKMWLDKSNDRQGDSLSPTMSVSFIYFLSAANKSMQWYFYFTCDF